MWSSYKPVIIFSVNSFPMTKEKIFEVLDANIAKNKTALKIMIWIGGIFMLGGLALYLFLTEENDNNLIGGAALGGLGLLMVVGCVIALTSKSLENLTEEAKKILSNDPQQLVWSYVFKQNNRGAISISVMMNFRNGKTLSVDQNAIPNQNTTGFMHALAEINPNMHMGYSEELEYKFKKKTL